MSRFLHFLTYNNAVPIALSIVLLSAGAAFAASEEVQQAVYNSTDAVVAVDNTYLTGKNLDAFTPRAEITAVTEDAETYYVSYTLTTIDVVDAVWQDVVLSKQMEVSKALLGEYTDLGVYVTEQLKQVVARQMDYLREVQAIEQRQVSQKVVATTYGGLVGKFLDDSTETLPGSVPVVVAPQNPTEGQVAGAFTDVPSGGGTSPSDAGAPQLQVLGNNPARLPLKSSYVDLGVLATHSSGREFSIHMFVNDNPVTSVNIDTTVVGTTTIRYESTDDTGRTGRAERVVVVFDPNPVVIPEPEPIVETASEPTVAESEPIPSPTPPESSPETPLDPPPTDPVGESAPTEQVE